MPTSPEDEGDLSEMQTAVAPPGTGRSTTRVPDETLAEPARAAHAQGLPVVSRGFYDVGEEIARGGMGRILSALDLRLGRPVAIKEILPGTSEAAARFEREALTTARLQHPSIVNVYEAGRWPDGSPFYAMKLVDGQPLEDVVAARKSLDRRLALLPNVISVVEALAYAHAAGVIHRDLKPANVLVGSFGETVVIDWGLAKVSGDSAEVAKPGGACGPPSDIAELTAVGTVMGTPSYMSPEQARGGEVDARSDVYALGAILYHVLAGDRPYKGTSSAEVLKQVLAGPPAPLDEREPGVPVDLAAIVRKAMAPRAEDRYPTAGELAEDLKRFQTGQLVGAHRYSRRERVWRFVRRHRAVLSVATAAALIVAGSGTVSVQRIRHERSQAEVQRNALQAEHARNLVGSDPVTTLALLRQYPLDGLGWGTVRTIASEARTAGLPQAMYKVLDEDLVSLEFLPDGRLAGVGWGGGTLGLLDPASGRTQRLVIPVASCKMARDAHLAVSPDGTHVVSSGCDMYVFVWNVASGIGRALGGSGAERGHTLGLGWTPDGTHVWIYTTRGARVVDLASDKTQHLESAATSAPRQYAYAPPATSADGRWGASCIQDQAQRWSCRLYDRVSGSIRILPGGPAVTFSSDSKRLALGLEDGRIELLSLESHDSRVLSGHTETVYRLAFSPDGGTLASNSWDWSARIWNTTDGTSRVAGGEKTPPGLLLFSPDGTTLATVPSTQRHDEFWTTTLATGERRVIRQSQQRTWGNSQLVFSPDSTGLAFGGAGGEVLLYSVRRQDGESVRPGGAPPSRIAFSRDGLRLATGAGDGTVCECQLSTHACRVLGRHEQPVYGVGFAADGRIASMATDGFRLWDFTNGESRMLGIEGNLDYADISADGRRAATGTGHGLRVWDLANGAPQPIGAPRGQFRDCSLSPDGRFLLGLGSDSTAQLWTVDTGAGRTLRFPWPVASASFSRDGRWIAASGGNQPDVELISVATGDSRFLRVGVGGVAAMAFSPDGRTLAVTQRSGGLRLIAIPSGETRELASPPRVEVLAWSPDGRTLAGNGARIQIWDVQSGERREGGLAGSFSLAGSPRESLFAINGADSPITLWRDDLPREPVALRAWMETAIKAPPESQSLGATPGTGPSSGG